jgi:hypothetical protein
MQYINLAGGRNKYYRGLSHRHSQSTERLEQVGLKKQQDDGQTVLFALRPRHRSIRSKYRWLRSNLRTNIFCSLHQE